MGKILKGFWNEFWNPRLNICGSCLEINDRTQRQKQRLGEEIKTKIDLHPHLTDVFLYFSPFLSMMKIVSFPKYSEKLLIFSKLPMFLIHTSLS